MDAPTKQWTTAFKLLKPVYVLLEKEFESEANAALLKATTVVSVASTISLVF